MMGNALRFIRYTFVGIREPRHRHQKSWLKRNGMTLLASFSGALVLTLPAWMIVLGVI